MSADWDEPANGCCTAVMRATDDQDPQQSLDFEFAVLHNWICLFECSADEDLQSRRTDGSGKGRDATAPMVVAGLSAPPGYAPGPYGNFAAAKSIIAECDASMMTEFPERRRRGSSKLTTAPSSTSCNSL